MSHVYEVTESPRQRPVATRGNVYHLRVRVDEAHNPTCSALLFSLAQRMVRAEKRGEVVEQVHVHLTGDGDYSAIALVYPADIDNAGPASSGTTETSTSMAEDDISAAEEARNGAQREADEAERLRKIEEFRQAEAAKWQGSK